MVNVLLVAKEPDTLVDFAAELSKRPEIMVSRAASGRQAWMLLKDCRVDVVVTEEELADGAALPFVRELIRQQPLINCAMVSSLVPDEFHEATEGLGIFMQLPVRPGAAEAVKMLQLLESINALIGM